MIIPADLVDAEQRRLQTICVSIQNQITQMAQSFKSESSDAVQAQPEVLSTSDFQPLFDNGALEAFNDELELFPCF